MTSVPDLNSFLEELGSRRRRLVGLAEPADLGPTELLDELRELSEQLILADEELRVQQQELEEAREGLVALAAERELLLEHSSKAYVVTDERGVVRQATRAAQQLVRQSLVRTAPRPIASWFVLDDRRTVRSLISRANASGEPQRGDARVDHRGGEPETIRLAVEPVTDQGGGRSLLRWELSAPSTPLHAVPSPEPGGSPALALQLAEAAEELAACRTRTDLIGQVLALALRLVPGAQDAGLVLRGPGRDPSWAGSTSAAAEAADRAQVAGETGPVARALTAPAAVRSDRLGAEVRAPDGDVEWPGCAVATPLAVGERRLGVLTVYADQPGSLHGDAEAVVSALGTHVAVALHRLVEADGLQEAIASRQLIGQAVGLLVERHQITPDAAFARLATWSQHHNVKLRTIAQTLVKTGQEPPAPPSR